MHYYQHHIGDFIKDTARLSDSQAMAYLRLIWMYYDQEKALKPDTKILAFQIGASIEDTQLLLEAYFIETPSGWMHSRCEAEIAEYHEFLEKKSNAGRASAERRKIMRSTDVEQVLNSSSTDVQLTTNHKPLTTNQINTKSNRGTRLPVDFVLPEEWIQFCKTERKDLNPEKVFAEFKDYWTALPAGKGTKADWTATWRNWVRRQSAPKQTFAQQAADIARMTVPSTAPDRDPVLIQLEQDYKKATPMPANIREMMQGVVKRI